MEMRTSLPNDSEGNDGSETEHEVIHADISINNVVKAFSFDCAVQLALLNFPNTERREGQFPALQLLFRCPDGGCSTSLLFRTSSVTKPGSKSEMSADASTQDLRLFLENQVTDRYAKYGWPACGPQRNRKGTVLKLANYSTVNVVATVRVKGRGFDIDRMSADSNGKALYHPHIFSAATSGGGGAVGEGADEGEGKEEERKKAGHWCQNTFQTGTLNTMAHKTERDAIEAAIRGIMARRPYLTKYVQQDPNMRHHERLTQYANQEKSAGSRPVVVQNGMTMTAQQFFASLQCITNR